MALFQALDTAVSGASMNRMWLDTIAHNVANVNTTSAPGEDPFAATQLIVEEIDSRTGAGKGVRVRELTESQRDPSLRFEPGHPNADEFGLVRGSNVSLDIEMTNLMIANRAYSMNISVMQRAVSSYRSALQIGRQ